MKRILSFALIFALLLSASVLGQAESGADVQAGDIIIFGHYEQDLDRQNGPEPIEWRVIEVKDGKAMVISLYGLDVREYHRSFPFPTWANSDLREWLNSTFLNTAFTAKEQQCIDVTHVVTLDNDPWVEYRKATDRKYEAVSDGSAVDDKLFLLSTEEAMRWCGVDSILEELNSTEAREILKATPTKYALARGAFQYNGGSNDYRLNGVGCCWWMMRSPGHLNNHAAYVGTGGNINSFHYTDVHRAEVCTRPVCWVDLAALSALNN